MADGAQRQLQQSEFPDRSAGAGAQEAAVSADNAFSVSETRRLQLEAQRRIAAARGPNQIGAAP